MVSEFLLNPWVMIATSATILAIGILAVKTILVRMLNALAQGKILRKELQETILSLELLLDNNGVILPTTNIDDKKPIKQKRKYIRRSYKK